MSIRVFQVSLCFAIWRADPRVKSERKVYGHSSHHRYASEQRTSLVLLSPARCNSSQLRHAIYSECAQNLRKLVAAAKGSENDEEAATLALALPLLPPPLPPKTLPPVAAAPPFPPMSAVPVCEFVVSLLFWPVGCRSSKGIPGRLWM